MKCLPVVLLAGGMATRIAPLSDTCAKSMLRFNERPFIFYQLEELKKQGVTQVLLCVGRMAEQIKHYVGDGSGFGLDVKYSDEGLSALGTAGALYHAMDLLPEVFFVQYGDSYLLCDYAKMQEAFFAQSKLAMMSVFLNRGKHDKSNIVCSDGEILVYDKHRPTDKMQHIDYGLSIISRRALENLASFPSDLADVFSSLLEARQLASFEVKEAFYEVGSFAGIDRFENYISCRKK